MWAHTEVQKGWIDKQTVATRPKSADVKNRPMIAAVEVDPAGCSYNPDYEQHQDAVAVAVAAENLKLIDRELQPKVCAFQSMALTFSDIKRWGDVLRGIILLLCSAPHVCLTVLRCLSQCLLLDGKLQTQPLPTQTATTRSEEVC